VCVVWGDAKAGGGGVHVPDSRDDSVRQRETHTQERERERERVTRKPSRKGFTKNGKKTKSSFP